MNKKGRILPSLFSHVHDRGCSVQRDSIADDDQIAKFVEAFLAVDEKRTWHGVVVGRTEDVRTIRSEDMMSQAVCVLDTANVDNTAHAEMVQSHYIVEEADRLELRHRIYAAFNCVEVMKPRTYRGGAILLALPGDLANRAS